MRRFLTSSEGSPHPLVAAGAIVLAVRGGGLVTGEGGSHWLEGLPLLAVPLEPSFA